MIFNMKIRNNNVIRVKKNEYLTKVNPDGNPYHEAHVPTYTISIGIEYKAGGSDIRSISYMTLEDLKELRKVIRKVIKDESH